MFARSLLVLLVAVPLVNAGDQAKALVEKQVKDWKGDGYRIAVVEEKYLRDVFPKHTFVGVHFPLYPVARVPADPLKSQNLFAVSKDGKVTHLPDSKKLEGFFKSTLKTIPNNLDPTVQSWLRLRTEYIQDGFFKFKYPAELKTGLGHGFTYVTGAVEVVPQMGNMGSYTATLTFGKDALTGVKEQDKVRAGIRPRCQATLLLHPEKLVREIAEQDLLVMGSMARGYLFEQRTKANNELKREIDRVWRRIEMEGR